MTRKQLKEVRAKLGLTQKKMAKALNTPFSTYQKWEDGRTPNVPGIVEIAVKQVKGGKSGNNTKNS